jgi:hypothetical protein
MIRFDVTENRVFFDYVGYVLLLNFSQVYTYSKVVLVLPGEPLTLNIAICHLDPLLFVVPYYNLLFRASSPFDLNSEHLYHEFHERISYDILNGIVIAIKVITHLTATDGEEVEWYNYLEGAPFPVDFMTPGDVELPF